MKKRLKHAEDVTVGDTIKITGHIWEVDEVNVNTDTHGFVELQLWAWAAPRKRVILRFNDRKFPVTVR